MDLNLSIYKFPNIEVGLTGHRWPRLVVGKLDQQMVESLIHRYLRTLELVVGLRQNLVTAFVLGNLASFARVVVILPHSAVHDFSVWS